MRIPRIDVVGRVATKVVEVCFFAGVATTAFNVALAIDGVTYLSRKLLHQGASQSLLD